jgi:hypothetical protein
LEVVMARMLPNSDPTAPVPPKSGKAAWLKSGGTPPK